MNKAVMKITSFDSKDVISTSAFIMSGFHDDVKGNVKLMYGTTDVTSTYFTSGYSFIWHSSDGDVDYPGNIIATINDSTDKHNYGSDEVSEAPDWNGEWILTGTTFDQKQ